MYHLASVLAAITRQHPMEVVAAPHLHPDDFEKVDLRRKENLYPHEVCHEGCRRRGCQEVSTFDGLWKIQVISIFRLLKFINKYHLILANFN